MRRSRPRVRHRRRRDGIVRQQSARARRGVGARRRSHPPRRKWGRLGAVRCRERATRAQILRDGARGEARRVQRRGRGRARLGRPVAFDVADEAFEARRGVAIDDGPVVASRVAVGREHRAWVRRGFVDCGARAKRRGGGSRPRRGSSGERREGIPSEEAPEEAREVRGAEGRTAQSRGGGAEARFGALRARGRARGAVQGLQVAHPRDGAPDGGDAREPRAVPREPRPVAPVGRPSVLRASAEHAVAAQDVGFHRGRARDGERPRRPSERAGSGAVPPGARG